jgi:hypothetical protein
MALIISTIIKRKRVMLVVIGPDNVERMQERDPLELELYRMPFPEPVAVIGIVIASDAELTQLEQLMRQGKVEEAIERATSGWKYRPERGDHDLGPQRMGETQ